MKIQVSLSTDKFRFEYRVGDTTGYVLAPTVVSAVSQAKLDWSRQKHGPSSMRAMQGRGNRGVQDKDVVLSCPEASDAAIAELRRTIHVLVTEECRPATAQRERLSKLEEVNRQLQTRPR